MRRSSLVKPEAPSVEIDLTPMLDVVFIMLIFFIVTATFIKEPGVDVQRPDAQSSEFVQNQKILVAIAANGDIWINREQLKDHQVRAAIEQLHIENPQGAVVIQADKNSTAERVALVIDAAKRAGVAHASLATEQ